LPTDQWCIVRRELQRSLGLTALLSHHSRRGDTLTGDDGAAEEQREDDGEVDVVHVAVATEIAPEIGLPPAVIAPADTPVARMRVADFRLPTPPLTEVAPLTCADVPAELIVLPKKLPVLVLMDGSPREIATVTR
jgi:hypothetical protein